MDYVMDGEERVRVDVYGRVFDTTLERQESSTVQGGIVQYGNASDKIEAWCRVA